MRLAIISDIHEDYPSLQKILKKLERLGYDKLVCLGDISGFSRRHYRYLKSRDASSSLRLLREKCSIILAGNHDLHVSRRLPVHSTIFDFPSDWYELALDKKSILAKDEIWLHEEDLDPHYPPDDLDFLATLPEFVILEEGGIRILLTHYAHPNLSGFRKNFYSWEGDFQSHFRFMEFQKCRLSFIGHAHPRGYYVVTPDRFRHYSYRKIPLPQHPAIVGVPPVTRHRWRSGFCIFDTAAGTIQAAR